MGAVVVLAGDKGEDRGLVQSVVVEEEVRIALEFGKPVIPIGQSGHVARAVWDATCSDPGRYLQGIDGATVLQQARSADESAVEEAIAAVAPLLEKAERLASAKGANIGR